jgi:hypothetical protein
MCYHYTNLVGREVVVDCLAHVSLLCILGGQGMADILYPNWEETQGMLLSFSLPVSYQKTKRLKYKNL